MSVSSIEGSATLLEKVDSIKNELKPEVDSAVIQNLQAGIADGSNKGKVLVDDDFSPLSGKPYYHTVVTKTHLKPLYHMVFGARLHKYLPSKVFSATVACRGKTWEMMFIGNRQSKKFDNPSWRKFVHETDLRAGDALFWELMERSAQKLDFKLQIIKGDFPLELAEISDDENQDNIIVID